MLKNIFKATIIGLGVVAAAATVHAATTEVTLYGASAEYKLWNDLADNFCTDNGWTPVGAAKEDTSGKHGIIECTKNSGADTLIIRYTSKASYDGIYSATGTTVPAALGGQPSCTVVDEREVAGSYADPDTLVCKQVTLGASDVPGAAFGQESHGDEDGQGPGTETIDRVVDAINIAPDYPSTLVVPFGFFANSTALPGITNLTQVQAGIIFSGTWTNWADFAGNDGSTANAGDPNTYPNKYVIGCYRHAGSGTHATMAADVMAPAKQSLPTNEALPYIQFNDGSSDMQLCVENNGYEGTGDYEYGAVGYMDCDRTGSNMHLLTYMGVACNKDNIINGVYPFWNANVLYVNANAPAAAKTVANQMATYAKSHVPASKADWWPTEAEMRVTKPNGYGWPILPKGTSTWGY